MSGLVVDHVDKSYGNSLVLSDVNMKVESREFMALLGPNGAGKSTLLRSIAGLESVDSGSISIGGLDITTMRPRERKVSMVFQSYAVFPNLSVRHNIAFGLQRIRRPKDEVEAQVQKAAELVGLADALDQNPNDLEGDHRQRVAVARAIAYGAELLLMDEPLSNLDPHLRIEMRSELKRLLKEVNATVVYVTRDEGEASDMGDRITHIDGGKIRGVTLP